MEHANPFDIMKQVEQLYFIKRGSIVSHKRTATVALARHVAMFLVRKNTKFTLHEIADIFDVDHTSVIYGIRRIRETKDVDVLEIVNKL